MTNVRGRVVALAAELNHLKTADLDSLPTEELLHIRSTLSVIRRDLDLLDHKVVAIGSRKDAHQNAGAASMTALISATTGVTRRQAAKTVRLAQHIEESPILAVQMSKPGMSPVKAHMITEALDRLPADLTAAQRRQIEKELAEAAPGMSVEQFRRKTKRALETINITKANQIENDELITNEAAALRKATFWMSRPDQAGMVKGGFAIDAITADMLRSVLESKTAPRHLAIQERNETQTSGATGIGAANSNGGSNSQVSTAPSTNSNATSIATTSANPAANYRETQGQAFIEILRHLPRDGYGNHGGVAATLMVTISEDSLRKRTEAAGVTDRGTPVSASQLRQLACNAGVLPVILGTASQPLDIGREQRLHTSAQRKALAHRDDGCAFPGCDRPPGWCETHHIKSWASGGKTSVDNGVLLCGYHHRHVHNSDWRIELNRRDSTLR